MKLSRTLLLVAVALLATVQQLPTTTGHATKKAAVVADTSATPATMTAAAKLAAHNHDHHGHDHDHDHDHDHGHDDVHGHDEVARRHAQETSAKEGAHGHGANDHDHDHDGHDVAHHDHDGHHHDHVHGDSKRTVKAAAAPTRQAQIDRFSPKIWLEALFATALVGAAPVLVLFFVPLGLGNQEAQKPLLRVFLSFAAGGLLGDALLHLLPHSIPQGGHDHDHDHDHGHEGHAHSIQDLSVWLYCIAGMMTFLMLEKFVRAQTGGGSGTGGHGHSHGGHSHSHASSTAASSKLDGLTATATARKRGVAAKETDDHDDEVDASQGKPPPVKQIAAAGYLNLAADFTHNFTDGLAIGATFLRGSGWQTTVAMLLHELPHEIGDFAILIQSGFTRREAMFTQLLTAIGAMVGTVLGLLMEGAGDSSSAWISPFTAGGFIYIACASVMPELLEDCSLVQSLKEGVSMCVGIGLMIVIALNE